MTQQVIVKPNQTVQAYSSADDVRALDNRLKAMLPGAEKLSAGQRMALAQAALAHGLDPFNGEIWMIPGRGLMVGIKGLRKKAHQQVKGNYWPEFRLITNEEERAALRIPVGSLAYECRLFDSENIRAFSETVERLLKAGIPWTAVEGMVGSKPYTPGIGVLLAGESTKMQPAQCAMKRAEADAIKRRFDVPFGLDVAEDDDGPEFVEFVPPTEADPEPEMETKAESTDYQPSAESIAETEAQLKRKRTREALYPSD